MRGRLHDTFGSELSPYEVIGDPKDLSSAQALAQQDRYQFQWWAVGLVEGRPAQDKKKGADAGIDGYLYFFDDNSGKAKKIIIQVKSGHVSVRDIRDLKGVLGREKAELGTFITLEESTKPMQAEALSAGFYESEFFRGSQFPRMQILTIAELLAGRRLEYPRGMGQATFKKAERKKRLKEEPRKLPFESDSWQVYQNRLFVQNSQLNKMWKSAVTRGNESPTFCARPVWLCSIMTIMRLPYAAGHAVRGWARLQTQVNRESALFKCAERQARYCF
jgi:hypothetical protein